MKDFRCNYTNQTHKIKYFLNCNTTYVVYHIVCTLCDLTYVGCTKRTLKKRIAEHVADIVHKRVNVSGASKHFIDKRDGSRNSFTFYAIERVEKPKRGGNWEHKMHNREVYWILVLQFRFPMGLNYRSDLLYIY